MSLRARPLRRFGRVTKQVERHDGVHHRRINRTETVGKLEPGQHPLLRLVYGPVAYPPDTVALPPFQEAVEPDEQVVPGEEVAVTVKIQRLTGQKQLLQVEPRRNRAALAVERLDDGQRHEDGAR